ncbi:MAG: hypothetical protein H0U49_09235 [Parachlamydiaceae bacterium]|nr:hypothetical protein [Parachlamydiaceae bacterium]
MEFNLVGSTTQKMQVGENVSFKEQGLPMVKSIFNDMQMELHGSNIDQRMSIREKDIKFISNVLDNYVANCPAESAAWFEKIQAQCNQFIGLRKMEIQNQNELEEAKNGINESTNGLRKTSEELEKISEDRIKIIKSLAENNALLDENLMNLQKKVEQTSIVLKDYVNLQGAATAAFYGLVGFGALTAYSFSPVAGQCMPVANSTLAACGSSIYNVIPSLMYFGLPAIGCKMVSNFASLVQDLEKTKEKIIDEKLINESTYKFLDKLNKEKEEAKRAQHNTILNNLDSLIEKSNEAQGKKDSVQKLKNEAIAEVMTEVFAETLETLRLNEEMLEENPESNLAKKQSYTVLKTLTGSMLSIYALKADSLHKALEGQSKDQGRVQEIEI